MFDLKEEYKKLQEEHLRLQIKFDNYDEICFDLFMLGLASGMCIILTVFWIFGGY